MTASVRNMTSHGYILSQIFGKNFHFITPSCHLAMMKTYLACLKRWEKIIPNYYQNLRDIPHRRHHRHPPSQLQPMQAFPACGTQRLSSIPKPNPNPNPNSLTNPPTPSPKLYATEPMNPSKPVSVKLPPIPQQKSSARALLRVGGFCAS